MKTKNKALALVLALMLALTLCPLSGFAAETTVDGLIIDDVTGSQVATAITGDLSLPAGYTWTSSDDSVIAIGTETEGVIPATVTRKLGEDRAVTLTASDGTNEKSFDVVVLAKEKVVIASGTSAGGEHDVLTAKNTDWYKDDVNENLSIAQEADGNYYQKYDFTYANSNFDTHFLTNEQNEALTKSGKFVCEFDFMYDQNTQHLPVQFRVKVGDKNLRFSSFNNGSVYAGEPANGGNSISLGLSKNSSAPAYSLKEWTHVKYEFDLYTCLVTLTMNNQTVSGYCKYTDSENNNYIAPQAYLDEVLESGILGFGLIKGATNSDCGVFSLDNFCVYATDYTALSEADRADYIAGLSWSDFSDKDLSVMENGEIELDNLNGFLNWTAEGSGVVVEDMEYTNTDATVSHVYESKVTFTQPIGNTANSVILTASDANGTAAKKFNISLMPADFTTDLDEDTTKDELLYTDFEEGIAGNAVNVYEFSKLADLTGDLRKVATTTNPWGTVTGVAPTFTYVNDAEKGMAAKISGDKTYVYLKPGVQSSINVQSALTGFDVKFSEGETANSYIQISLEGADTLYQVRVYSGKVLFTNGANFATYSTDTSGWINIAVESNFASRTDNLYINGVKVNDAPLPSRAYSRKDGFSDNQRGIKIYPVSTAEALIDNIYSIANGDDDEALVQAAIEAVQVYYKDAYMTGKNLETKGPKTVHGRINIAANGFASDAVSKDVSGDYDYVANNTGADIVWSGKNVSENVFSPALPADYNLTVMATSGEKTASTEIAVKAAPVIISVDAEGNVTLSGNTEGGTLIVATMDGDKLSDAKVYTSFDSISVADIASYKLIFIDSIGNLAPLAYSISK